MKAKIILKKIKKGMDKVKLEICPVCDKKWIEKNMI